MGKPKRHLLEVFPELPPAVHQIITLFVKMHPLATIWHKVVIIDIFFNLLQQHP